MRGKQCEERLDEQDIPEPVDLWLEISGGDDEGRVGVLDLEGELIAGVEEVGQGEDCPQGQNHKGGEVEGIKREDEEYIPMVEA